MARFASTTRMRAVVIAVCALVGATAVAHADTEKSVGGWLGFGGVDGQAATTVDIGADLTGDSWGLGIGGRLQYVGDSLRREAWDDRSEYARPLRYLYYKHEAATWGVGGIIDQLGDAQLGHGSVLDQFSSGLNFDHHRTGAQFRLHSARTSFEALAEDILAPGIVAARLRQHALASGWQLAITAASDLDRRTQSPLVTSVDVEYRWVQPDQHVAVYTDIVAFDSSAGGLHVGSVAHRDFSGGRVRGRAEAFVGSRGYRPRYFGVFYERRRFGDMAAAVGNTDDHPLGVLTEASVDIERWGRLRMSYQAQYRRSDLTTLRLELPYHKYVQGALWFARTSSSADFAMAGELRIAFPRRIFGVVELSSLYRETDMGLTPVRSLHIGFGYALDSAM